MFIMNINFYKVDFDEFYKQKSPKNSINKREHWMDWANAHPGLSPYKPFMITFYLNLNIVKYSMT